MSMLGEVVLKAWLLARGRQSPPPPQRHQSWEEYIRWQYESSARLFAHYPHWDVAGKSVLEIGCGTGGRAAFLAAQGARRVVGIDIDAAQVEVANRFAPALYPDIRGRFQCLASQENAPLDIGTFDIVLLVDCIEHVVSPPHMLKLAYDYTAPGGRCYFSAIGYYHHHGAHVDIVPFVNLFFSEETILNVTRWRVGRPDYVPTPYDSDPPIERWRGIYDLRDRPGEHLNKLTLGEIKRLLRHSLFSETHMKIVGFGHSHPLLRVSDPLRHVPVVQEVYHSLVIAECHRRSVGPRPQAGRTVPAVERPLPP